MTFNQFRCFPLVRQLKLLLLFHILGRRILSIPTFGEFLGGELLLRDILTDGLPILLSLKLGLRYDSGQRFTSGLGPDRILGLLLFSDSLRKSVLLLR